MFMLIYLSVKNEESQRLKIEFLTQFYGAST